LLGEIKTAAKHVVTFDGIPSDGGSIPPASTIRLALRQAQGSLMASQFFGEANGASSATARNSREVVFSFSI